MPTVFEEFENWWQKYAETQAADLPSLVKAGEKIAARREKEMLLLLQNDPQKAIRQAFYEEYHNALPSSIASKVETHVRGLASLEVVRDKSGNTRRVVSLHGQSWDAWTSGTRLELKSREEIPVHGVVLGDKMALDASPLERFPDRESLIEILRQGEGKKTCPICGQPGTIPGAAGDILLWLDTQEHFTICEKALIEKESE